ncbi:MAG TPA: hypothetical protein VHR41_07865 [Gemmatimonadales bacterium]|jgi:hypothetical protein|nr:hypothetical protein [Gemmatimonadales bacterium]
MTAQPHRSYTPDPLEPVLYELPPLRLSDQTITLQLSVRRSEDGAWRGRLRFIDPGSRESETAEIFCGVSEGDLWQSVRGLGQHHIRALYLSLT